MTTANKRILVENPILRFIKNMGYRLIGPDRHPILRARKSVGTSMATDDIGTAICHLCVEVGFPPSYKILFYCKRG